MNTPDADGIFDGSIPALYDSYLVPLIFAPYAADLAGRLALLSPARVLEIAAGTGVVTRAMARALPSETAIVATDLNAPMLAHATSLGTARPVEWRQAGALHLPFEDGAFDAVVCQFGVMFLADKARAFAEARRVLRPGGTYLFNVWDRIEKNEFAATVTAALEQLFPADPPRFMARTPHGYHDRTTIARDLAIAGFAEDPDIETMSARSQATSARVPAVAYCQGTPLRSEIEARGTDRLGDATAAARAAIAARFGSGAVDGRIQAHVITIER